MTGAETSVNVFKCSDGWCVEVIEQGISHTVFGIEADAYAHADMMVKKIAGPGFSFPRPEEDPIGPFGRRWKAFQWWLWWRTDALLYWVEEHLRPKD
jgi:hypothetical protein